MAIYRVTVEAVLTLDIDAPEPQGAQNAAGSVLTQAMEALRDKHALIVRYAGIGPARVQSIEEQ